MDDLNVKNTITAKKPIELVSVEECKQCLKKYNLPDDQVLQIKDNLIGIVDSIINSYLDEFDQT